MVESLSHPPSDARAHLSAAEIERARRGALCPSERADAISYDWGRIGFGIVLAGGAYPVVLAGFATIFGAAVIAWSMLSGEPNGPGILEATMGLFVVGINSTLGGIAGLVWSGFVTALTLPVIYLVVWSLQLRQSIVWLGAFAGGLVGFIAALPIILFSFRMGEVWEIAILLLLGPGLTTIFGQIGGAWGGSKSREIGPAIDWQKYLIGLEAWKPWPYSATSGNESDRQTNERPRIQFRIRHLLWLAVWLSLLLTLIRLCRIPFEFVLPLLVGWLAFQAATLWLGAWLVRRLGPWWARRRQTRSA